MILFRPEHVPAIQEGRKTQTRRLGAKRWNIGSVHQAKTKLFGKPFALLVIGAVRQEPLRAISDDDMLREGYETKREYLDAFARINGEGVEGADRLVWVVDFVLMRGIRSDTESPTFAW